MQEQEVRIQSGEIELIGILCSPDGVIVFTQQVNLPLNYYTESWQPFNLPVDWMETRDRWNDANAVRVVTSFLPFLFCVVALALRANLAATPHQFFQPPEG